MTPPDEVREIPLDEIVEPRFLLRLVNRNSVEYLEMRDSIKECGLWNSISVRPAQAQPCRYEIIDGLHRYTCCRELGLKSVPAIVKHVSGEQVLAAQVQANAIGTETTRMEFARRLKRILLQHPGTTITELARLVHKSPQWVGVTLGLLQLATGLQKLVDRGEIPIASAYMLAKMPRRFQLEFADRAKSLPVEQFRALAAGVIKEYMEAVRQGKLDRFYETRFTPQPHLRPLKEVLAELAAHAAEPSTIVAESCKTPLDGFRAALRWVAHLDRHSADEFQAKARLSFEAEASRAINEHQD